jgi:hypothetical protein
MTKYSFVKKIYDMNVYDAGVLAEIEKTRLEINSHNVWKVLDKLSADDNK